MKCIDSCLGGLLIGRTVALLVPFTLATSLAAQNGPTQMAGHQIVLEVWLAVSLLTDALAIAAQVYYLLQINFETDHLYQSLL